MEIIQLREPGQLVHSTITAPREPAPHEALVRVRRVGICGTDLHAFQGTQPFLSYPRVLGHELGVEIVNIGDNEHGLKIGDRCAVSPHLNCSACIACRRGKPNCCVHLKVLGVHIDGGMSEFICVPQDKLHRSASLSFDQLALVEPLSIGAHAVARANLEPGEFVLVVGVGPIGLSVMQFAQLAGARVIAMDLNEDRLRFANQYFALERVIKAGEGALEQLQEATSADLPTAVFDATGNARSMESSFPFVAHSGRLIFVGLIQGDLTFSDPDAHRRELTVLFSRNSTGADFRRIITRLEQGEFEVTHWITHRVGFGQVVAEFPQWLDPASKFVKALIEM